jgi:hypothetical protein
VILFILLWIAAALAEIVFLGTPALVLTFILLVCYDLAFGVNQGGRP